MKEKRILLLLMVLFALLVINGCLEGNGAVEGDGVGMDTMGLAGDEGDKDEGDCDYPDGLYGDPRTIGFWKHQAKAAVGKGKQAHITADELMAYLPLFVFDAVIEEVQDLFDVLWLQNVDMQERAIQQCTATALNLRSGQLCPGSEVDSTGDGNPDGTLSEALTAAAAAYYAGDYEAAKDICDTINNL